MTTDDWTEHKSRLESFESRLASAMNDGVAPGSPEANDLAEEHRAILSEWFAESHSMHVLISRGYVADAGFREHYDSRAEGLTKWLVEVIGANAAANGVDPETAELV